MGDTPVRLSLFVVCELEAGAALAHSLDERERVRRLCQECEVVDPDEHFAPLYAETLASLKQQGFTIATMDLLIAIQALALNDTLITRNARHLQKIPHPRLEDY